MITKIIYKHRNECFRKNQAFTLKPITLLVGDQGVGKSTILKNIRDEIKEQKNIKFEFNGVLNGILYYDSEKDSPRKQQPNIYKPIEYRNAVMDRFISHGEALLPQLEVIHDLKQSLILIDEPETALSIRSCNKIGDLIKKLRDQKNQIIIATHSPIIMELFPENLLNLETKKYTTFQTFKKEQSKY